VKLSESLSSVAKTISSSPAMMTANQAIANLHSCTFVQLYPITAERLLTVTGNAVALGPTYGESANR
jgi:hypothetical protein